MATTESELLRRYVENRDTEAFRLLVEEHSGMVYGVCRRILRNASDAEDAAQNCFFQLARKARRLKSPIAGWMHRVAVNMALNMREQRTVRRAHEARAAAGSANRRQPAWDDVQDVVDEVIAELPERLRLPVVMHYLEGRSQQEIAAALGITQSGVSRRLTRGVEALRKRFARTGLVVSGAALASLLATKPAEAAPATLTSNAGKMAFAGLASDGKAGTSLGGIAMLKWGVVAAVAVAAIVTVVLVAQSTRSAESRQPGAAVQAAPQDAAPEVKPKDEGPPTQEPSTASGNVTRDFLPYDLSAVAGMASLKDAGDAARDMLARNGFVVLPQFYHQIFSPYVKGELPPFVTMDSLHRTFHVILEEQVKRMETAAAPEVAAISADMAKGIRALLARSRMDAPSAQAGSLAEAYFTVGALLLDEKIENADPRATAEIRLIEAAAGSAQSPLFGYEVDYSQFKPRGFYNDTPLLQRFFRAMTWYGDMAFRQCSDPETRAARFIAEQFQSVRERWERIDRLYAHFIGLSDDLSPAEYADVLARTGQDANAFAAEVAKLRDPKYNSMVIAPERMNEWRKWTKGMRFFGKRYLPDGEIFMALAYARPPKLLPSGLDVAAVNGCPRAQQLLQAQGALNAPENLQRLTSLQRTLAELKSSKQTTHYVEFLRLTDSLWMPPPDGAPAFMKTAAYADKSLTTALAAWASMRHTWQLQAKQSVTYAGAMGERPAGYVEPNLEFMQRLDALTARTTEILKDVKGADLKRLEEFRSLVADLRHVAQKQLDGRPLVGKDEKLLKWYGPTIGRLMYFEGNSWKADENLPWMSLIADVHTEHLTAETLEVGTGGAMPIYVIVPVAGKLSLMVGGVYSYYEFGQPIADRLTDDGWRRRWDTGKIPPAPMWTASYVAGVDIGPLIEKLKQGEIVEDMRYASDPRIEEALTKELAPGGAFAEDGQKRQAALWLLAARTGREALPLLEAETMKGQRSQSDALAAALATAAEPQDMEEFKSRAMTSTGPDAVVFAQALAARADTEAFRMLTDVLAGAASPDAKSVALRFVGEYGGRGVTPLLIKTAATTTDRSRQRVLRTLAQVWGGPSRGESMHESLLPAPSPTEEAQYRAQLVALTLELLKSDKREDRSGGCELAVALNAEEAIPVLEKMAFGTDSGAANEAQRALREIDCPAANPVLVRMLKLPRPDAQMIVDKLTHRQKCMEAWPALVEVLDNTDTSNGRRVCDWVVQGLPYLDPDGPGFHWFEGPVRPPPRAGVPPPVGPRDDLESMDRLVRCWKVYAEAKKGRGLAALEPAARVKYVEDLLAMTESVKSTWNGRDIGIKWTMQARPLAESLPQGDQRATLLELCRTLQVKLTQDEVLWIKRIFEDYYKRDFGDYPPETPGYWEKVVAERHIASVDKARVNAEGQFCDPWGNPYRYLRVSKHSQEPFEIYSFGPNGKDDDGKGDDLVSWK